MTTSPPTPTSSPTRRPARTSAEGRHKPLRILPYGLNQNRVRQASRNLGVPVALVTELEQADALFTLRTYYRKRPRIIADAERRNIPVYVLRNNTEVQMENYLAGIFGVEDTQKIQAAVFGHHGVVRTGKLSVGIAGALMDSMERFPSRFAELRLPILLLHGTADALADVNGSHRLEAGAVNADVTSHYYEGLYHEVFNEPEQAEVLGDLVAWLNATLGPDSGRAVASPA